MKSVRSATPLALVGLFSLCALVGAQEANKAPAAPAPKAPPTIAVAPPVRPPEEVKFQERQRALMSEAMKHATNQATYLVGMEDVTRQLSKEFPGNPQIAKTLISVAAMSEETKARALIAEVLASKPPADVITRAEGLLRRFDSVGKPLDIKFTAVDGREVDMAKLKGKVVLVDFWATWCGPCVAEVTNVVSAYDKLHDKGFEIVGISFDRLKDKEKLVTFTAEKSMKWPQFFDGGYWTNAFGVKYGINSIPAMWLVDKKGNLRDLNARDGLAARVEKLLAE